ncbi:DUF7287 family protein [Halorussus pelagicus]|uniref:DUF7287 family protein n=1 Tax=Halorussus pelagicus TaxID=2505977 RepID=UPI000FFBD6D1|nr:hypothetical protein [Halorussus pelagicus]
MLRNTSTAEDARPADERGDRSTAGEDENRYASRAQTSIDFVVGMSVFLLTVAFVVTFLPSAFEPFTATGSGDVLAADRTAGLLAEQLLAHPTTPGAFDPACTAEFFDAAGDGAGGVAGCQFTTDAADLDAALGLGPATAVNVTIAEDGTIRSRNGVTLAAGPTPPDSENVVVSRRVVLLGGDDADLYVRMW